MLYIYINIVSYRDVCMNIKCNRTLVIDRIA